MECARRSRAESIHCRRNPEIEGRVQEDWRRSVIREETEAAIADVVDSYDVRVEYERPRADPELAEGSAE